MGPASITGSAPVEDWQRPLVAAGFVAPSTVDQAVAAGQDEGAAYLAGGTYLVRFGRFGGTSAGTLVYLGGVADLARVERHEDRTFVGGTVVHGRLEGDPALDGCDVLRAAAAEIAGPAVRNLATVGGNVVIDWDLAPALLALDAQVVVADADGQRTVDLAALRSGASPPLDPGALVTGVWLDRSLPRQAYAKIARRRAVARAIVGVGVALDVVDGTIRTARVGIGGSALPSRRLPEVEHRLQGAAAEPATFAAAGQLAEAATADAGTDADASAWYVREMARVMTERALARAVA